MLTLAHKAAEEVQAQGVRFADDKIYVLLSDGREVGLPLDRIEWLSWLEQASPEQRARWSIEPGGFAIYWEDLDNGFEVRHILELQPLA